jgi:hypothetical protein
MDGQRVKQQCKEEYSPPAVGEKEEHGGKKEGKKKKNKKLQNNKVGPTLELGPLYNPLDLGLEVVATSKTQFVFFIFLLKLMP